MPANESAAHIAKMVYCSGSKSKLTEWFMPVNLEIELYKPRYTRDCWVVQFKNQKKFNNCWSGTRCIIYTKKYSIEICEITLDLSASLTCKALVHCQSSELVANCLS